MRYLERALRAVWGFLLWTHPPLVLLASAYELGVALRAAGRALGLRRWHVAALVVLLVGFSLAALTALLLRVTVPSLLTLGVGTAMALLLGKGWVATLWGDARSRPAAEPATVIDLRTRAQRARRATRHQTRLGP